MKRNTIALILSAILIGSSFAGCSKNEESVPSPEPTETVSPEMTVIPQESPVSSPENSAVPDSGNASANPGSAATKKPDQNARSLLHPLLSPTKSQPQMGTVDRRLLRLPFRQRLPLSPFPV